MMLFFPERLHCSYLYSYYNCSRTLCIKWFSISYWDLIKFPYFTNTTKRGVKRGGERRPKDRMNLRIFSDISHGVLQKWDSLTLLHSKQTTPSEHSLKPERPNENHITHFHSTKNTWWTFLRKCGTKWSLSPTLFFVIPLLKGRERGVDSHGRPDGWTEGRQGRMTGRTDSGEASFLIPTSLTICNNNVRGKNSLIISFFLF
jgi:hypothetical protein